MAEDPEFERFMRNEPVNAAKAPAWYGPVPPSQSKEVADQQSLTDSPFLRGAAITATQVPIGLVQDVAAPFRWATQGYNVASDLIGGKSLGQAIDHASDNVPNFLKPDVIGYNMTPNDLRPMNWQERAIAIAGRGAGEGIPFGGIRGAIGGIAAAIPTFIGQEIGAPSGATTAVATKVGAKPATVATGLAANLGFAGWVAHSPAVSNLANRILAFTAPGILHGGAAGLLTGSTMGDLAPNYIPPGQPQRNPLTNPSGGGLPLYARTGLDVTQNVLQSQRAMGGQ